MDVIEIMDDNIEIFEELLGEDLTEDLSREFYRGFGAVGDNGEAKGVFVYELINMEHPSEDIRGALRFIRADSEDTGAALHRAYREEGVGYEGIAESFYQFEDEELADACENEGFSKEARESEIIRITLKEAGELPFVRKVKKIPYYIASIGELTDMQYRSAIKNFLFQGQKGLLEDLGYLKRDWFDTQLSTCIITDNEINGFFLVRATPSGILVPVLLYAQGADCPKNILRMLTLSITMAQRKYSPETEILVCRSKKRTWDLMKKLFPTLHGETAFFGRRNEE